MPTKVDHLLLVTWLQSNTLPDPQPAILDDVSDAQVKYPEIPIATMQHIASTPIQGANDLIAPAAWLLRASVRSELPFDRKDWGRSLRLKLWGAVLIVPLNKGLESEKDTFEKQLGKSMLA